MDAKRPPPQISFLPRLFPLIAPRETAIGSSLLARVIDLIGSRLNVPVAADNIIKSAARRSECSASLCVYVSVLPAIRSKACDFHVQLLKLNFYGGLFLPKLIGRTLYAENKVNLALPVLRKSIVRKRSLRELILYLYFKIVFPVDPF